MMNRQCAAILGVLILIVLLPRATLAARGETPAAFGRRCIPPPPQRGCRVGGPGAGCVAPRSNTPGIAPHRAQDARWGPRSALVAPHRRGPHGADCAPWGGGGRIAALGATLEFHHGLLGAPWRFSAVVRSTKTFVAGTPSPFVLRAVARSHWNDRKGGAAGLNSDMLCVTPRRSSAGRRPSGSAWMEML